MGSSDIESNVVPASRTLASPAPMLSRPNSGVTNNAANAGGGGGEGGGGKSEAGLRLIQQPGHHQDHMTDPLRSPSRNGSWQSRASSLHRSGEQVNDEPMSIVVFKWALIFVGIVMLVVVLVFMGEVIYAWSTGELYQQKMLAVANFTARMRKNSSDKVVPSVLDNAADRKDSNFFNEE